MPGGGPCDARFWGSRGVSRGGGRCSAAGGRGVGPSGSAAPPLVPPPPPPPPSPPPLSPAEAPAVGAAAGLRSRRTHGAPDGAASPARELSPEPPPGTAFPRSGTEHPPRLPPRSRASPPRPGTEHPAPSGPAVFSLPGPAPPLAPSPGWGGFQFPAGCVEKGMGGAEAMGGSFILPREHKPRSVGMRWPSPGEEGLAAANALLQTSRK